MSDIISDDVRIWYEKNAEGHPTGSTHAVIWKGTKRYVGVALCSENDQFERRKGRTIALGRARVASLGPHERVERGWPKYFEFDVGAPPEYVKSDWMRHVPAHLYESKKETVNAN